MIKKVLKGKMIRIYPNKSQQTLLAKTFGCNRFLWNQMLDMQNTRYNNCSDAKFVSTFGICVNCGTLHDRDINAAINIKEKGLTLL